jgi:hypothetical protein
MAATGTFISVEEYLRITTDPDCEYVRGVLEERPIGELEHACWQKALLGWFLGKQAEWQIKVYAELRVKPALTIFVFPT